MLQGCSHLLLHKYISYVQFVRVINPNKINKHKQLVYEPFKHFSHLRKGILYLACKYTQLIKTRTPKINIWPSFTSEISLALLPGGIKDMGIVLLAVASATNLLPCAVCFLLFASKKLTFPMVHLFILCIPHFSSQRAPMVSDIIPLNVLL